MKDKLLYIIIFGFAFILVTGGIFYLNTVFANIFMLDFSSPVLVQNPAATGESTKGNNISKDSSVLNNDNFIPPNVNTAAARTDTVIIQSLQDSSLIDTIKKLEQQVKDLAINNKEIETDTVAPKKELQFQTQLQDSIYKSWVKKTVSLYESMDSKKAAKIILTYSDNVAKDILYSMKKKKAADILTQFNPETVNRIMKVK